MEALALTSFDAPPAVVDLAEPVAGGGEVLIRVTGSSVNAFDVGVAAGAMKDFMPYEFPAVIGNDLVGVVVAAGEGVEGFEPGVRVFGMMGMKGVVHDGSFAEFANPQAGSVAVAPDGLVDEDAGALAVAGTTAMSAAEALGLREGARVLVLGATGGVGSFAIQLAARLGAHVIASVRPGDEDFVTALGAAETIDYTGDLAATLRQRYPDGVDGAIDAVNRDHDAFAATAGLVHDGGRATSVVGGAGEATTIEGISVSNSGSNPALLSPLANLVVEGAVRVAVRRTYALAEAASALQDFANEHTLGKLLITMT